MTPKMTQPATLHIAAQGDREIIITRVFDAPRRLVYEAHTKPELLKRWLGVREGWSLSVCEIDLRVGSAYRYVWHKESKGIDMGVGGVYREIVPSVRLVNTEKFDEPWYPGECLITAGFEEEAGKTTLTLTLRYDTPAARDLVLSSPMQRGLGESYNMLENLLSSQT